MSQHPLTDEVIGWIAERMHFERDTLHEAADHVTASLGWPRTHAADLAARIKTTTSNTTPLMQQRMLISKALRENARVYG